MSKAVIRATHLGKRYRIGGAQAGYKTLREALISAVGAPWRWLRRTGATPKTFWALDDISFEVAQGEAVGIIGRNGAGKSTLLKILSRITRPTRGKVEMEGRVSALLEVGTGFHGELTGRENIFLNGAILGMGRAEIRRKFDEIVEFAGIGQFLDTPVKYYSSGMYVRLAFAVAAHLEPEILVVDEVLAVGDAEFQKKCLNKMGTAASEGRTVLFVSHNMSAIQDLCSRVIWLDHGRIVQIGEARTTVGAYLSMHAQERKEQEWPDLATAPGNETVRVTYARAEAQAGHDSNYWTVETPLKLTFRIFNFRPDLPLYLNFHVYNQQGVCVFNTASAREPQPRGFVEGVCQIPGSLLNDDTYSVKFMAHYTGTFGVVVDDALVFEIHDIGRDGIDFYGKWIGVTRPKLNWTVRPVDDQGSDASKVRA
ncbi:MAG TPA: ABC transporter ATP-binding protein [Anaerolineales bacterium]|nr:ABC transporter ATP-binding protein [Anaerolineales bacterium]